MFRCSGYWGSMSDWKVEKPKEPGDIGVNCSSAKSPCHISNSGKKKRSKEAIEITANWIVMQSDGVGLDFSKRKKERKREKKKTERKVSPKPSGG